MNEDYDIEVPIDTQELEEMLLEDKSFQWVFPTLQDKNVQIRIKLFKEEYSSWQGGGFLPCFNESKERNK